MMNIKCYSELMILPTFQARYRYLRLSGAVGKETFGFDRYMNQFFYRSPEWKNPPYESYSTRGYSESQ